MPYLLDADTLIRAKNEHYGFEICPGFWEWLVRANEQSVVFSIQAIRNDLLRYMRVSEEDTEDELTGWARKAGPEFFLPPTASTFYAMQHISVRVQDRNYRPAAVQEFLRGSDYWLVAEGHARSFTVVTHEKPSPESVRKIKIPDACAAQVPPVECINVFEMLRREHVVFTLRRVDSQASS